MCNVFLKTKIQKNLKMPYHRRTPVGTEVTVTTTPDAG